MAKIIPGDVEYAYSRMYVVVNPDPALGPPTYRISIPEDLSGGGSGGGGGGGIVYDFDGVPPIVVNTTPGVGTNPTIIQTEMDIRTLKSR